MTQMLSTPYLTTEEEKGHAKVRKAEDYKVFCERVKKRWGLRKTKAIEPAFSEIQSLKHVRP